MRKRSHYVFCVFPLLFACGDETPTNAPRAGDRPAASIEEESVSDVAKGPIADGSGVGEGAGGDLATDVSAEDMAAIPSLLPTPAGNGPYFGTYLDLENFPYDSIVSGGPGKDGIPALTNPEFVSRTFVRYLNDSDMVLGVVIDGKAKAYPHNIGWWHEIVNDRIGGQAISVTFCPLTGTGLVFDTTDENDEQFELGVSGLLFNSNLVMYDRRDGATLYPQMAFKGVSGAWKELELPLLPVVETTWATWKELYPQTLVVAEGTYNLDLYTRYPYGDYRTDNSYFIFALETPLSRNANAYVDDLAAKDRVLGVRLDGHAMAYPLDRLGEHAVLNDRVGGVDIAVVWDREHHLSIPYARQVGERVLSFERAESEVFPYFGLRDRETGTFWTAQGEAISGELVGERLVQIPAHSSMWFAWVTFWQNTDIWP